MIGDFPQQGWQGERIGVTTSLHCDKDVSDRAMALGRRIDLPYIERRNRSIKSLLSEHNVCAVFVVKSNGLSFHSGGDEVFFHPGLAKLRIKDLKIGKTDQMIKAMDLMPGDTVLDCTLGMGADALVASHMTGPGGRVVGLESSPVTALITDYGTEMYNDADDPDLCRAMRRVEVLNIEHGSYLSGLPDNSFDIVYFDPMFRVPRKQSCSMAPLRMLANPGPINNNSVQQALRVSRKRVVMKERRGSREFQRLGFVNVTGGRHSPIAYGILEGRGMSHG